MRKRAWIVLVASALAAPGASARALPADAGDPDAFTGELEIVLWQALFRDPDADAGRANLVLRLRAESGRWDRVLGMALGYNNGFHDGYVEAGSADAGAIRLKVVLLTGADLWVPGGHVGVYAIDVKRGGRGRLEGRFDGTFRGRKVAGRASGEIQPPRPIRLEGFQPVRPEEHPRLLLRKYELPHLRRKLATPFGQAYMQKAAESGDIISFGVLYQLTGDRQYAQEALKVIRGYKGEIDHNGFGSGGFGHRLAAVCQAYDLCFDAWPEDFRKQLEDKLMTIVAQQQRGLPTGHANFHPCSNYYGPGRAVPALASLVLWGRKGPAPQEPTDPAGEAAALAPPAAFTPGKGVPVVDFAPGRFPPRWICAGPVAFKAEHDLLGSIGGYARARPAVGTSAATLIIVGGMPREASLSFRALPEAMVAEAGLDVGKLIGAGRGGTVVLFTALKVAAEQTVGLVGSSGDTRLWLAGVELGDRGFYRLKPGLYPMLVVHATAGASGPIAPRLDLASSHAFAERRAGRRLELAFWKADHEAWRQSGGADPRVLRFFQQGRRDMYRHYRLGIGDGGFQAETGSYASISSWYPLVYAAGHLRMLGRDLSPYPDVTHLMPRRMMQVLFRRDGACAADKINSVVGFDPQWCAAAFPIVPEKYRPALLWAWNHVTGAKDAASAANVLRGGGLNLAHAFLHYPLDMKPVHPGEIMPRTWQAPDFGFYCFRSGWVSDDDFIAQVFLKAKPVVGWNHPNAGTFRVLGLGHSWVAGSTSRNGVREQEPVVLLGEDETNEGACGRLAYLATQQDGSGALTIDMNDVYAATKTYQTKRGPRKAGLYDGNLLRLPDGFADSGITGCRAMAVDYSGRSGAPALMVLVDQVVGGGKRVWAWPLPKGAKDRVRIETGAPGFTLDYGDASMKVTFVWPREVELTSGTEPLKVGDPRHGFHGDVDRVKAVVPAEAAKAGRGSFFVVASFQRKDAPKVAVEGEGLDAKVTVGGQTVRFDPGPPARIVLGR